MARNTDPYRTLGLARGASLDEVKRAYRRLAKINHPDAAGPGALPTFLAIQAAYEEIAGGPARNGPTARSGSGPGRGGSPAAGRAPEAEPERGDATRRAYGPGRARTTRPGARPGPRPAAGAGAAGQRGGASPNPEAGRGPGRGKATLGSTSYDGADAGPFEPDWGGASWYGTTSGTYWTINPKEYADPRKHGPEYQARARRAATGKGTVPSGAGHDVPGPDPDASAGSGRAGAASHTTSSWWQSTAGPAPSADGDGTSPDEVFEAFEPTDAPPGDDASGPAARPGLADREPAPDPARAAVDLGRALTDPRSGGLRGRVLRAVLGWLPIALGIGWLVGEVSGCGRFAATCDPSVTPLVAVGQGIALAALLLLPEIAALAAGAALVLLGAAVSASLILSATGAAADEGSRRAALGALLVLAWLTGLAIALVRRFRSGPRPAGPVS